MDVTRLRPGMQASYVLFDLDFEADAVVNFAVEKTGTERIAGVDVPVATLARDDGTKSEYRIAGEGMPLEARWGAFTWKLEAPRQARARVEGFDAFADAVPLLGGTLGSLEKRDEVELLIHSEAATLPIPERANQHISREGESVRLLLRRGPSGAVTPEERAAAMRPDAAVNAGHPAIRERAQALIMGKTTAMEKIDALVHFTYRHLEKRLATHLNTASEVLAQGHGDCTEHSLLLIALLRASGLPAREVSGLLYSDDAGGDSDGEPRPRFSYHSWVEVELDGQWHPVDPSWDEISASPGHIALGVGKDTQWLATIGRLQLEVPGDVQKSK
jgi:hypothetical protein